MLSPVPHSYHWPSYHVEHMQLVTLAKFFIEGRDIDSVEPAYRPIVSRDLQCTI